MQSSILHILHLYRTVSSYRNFNISIEKSSRCSGYIEDYTTELCGDCKKNTIIRIPSLNNQYNVQWKVRPGSFFFVAHMSCSQTSLPRLLAFDVPQRAPVAFGRDAEMPQDINSVGPMTVSKTDHTLKLLFGWRFAHELGGSFDATPRGPKELRHMYTTCSAHFNGNCMAPDP